LNYLNLHGAKRKVKGLVMVSAPIDYPTSFYTILSRAYKKYDLARRILFMNHFSILREIDKLKERMFKHNAGLKPAWSNDLRQSFHFDGDDVKEVFKHASMLEFASPEALLFNSEYRRLLDKLSGLEGSELLLHVDEKVSAQLFHNECGAGSGPKCVLDMNHISLLEEMSKGYPVHAIYGDSDKMFSKGQVREIRNVLSSKRFSYICGSGHYPFMDQNDQFIETLCEHLSRIR
jgi:pimeloyl-ACP methyl ester carboxylesterase